MSLDDATRIVTRLGPCAIAVDRARHPTLAQQLGLLGCVVVDTASTAVVDGGEVSITAIPAQVDTLVVVAEEGRRRHVEASLLAGGWRRHPAGLIAAEVRCWNAEVLPRLSFYRRGVSACSLLDRGVDADPAIARFAAAAELVRPGDRVLVAGAEAEDGRAITAALSRGREIVAQGDAGSAWLGDRPPRSFDTIILDATGGASIDLALIDAAAQAIKADGRIVIGWQGDPRPIEALLEERFITERRIYQPHDGSVLIVASANPLVEAAGAPCYRHPAFHADGYAALPVLVDFAAAYDNPHLYRVMVQLGERLGDDVKLARLAECVLDEAGATSADRGAALTVLGYRVIDARLVDAIPVVIEAIDDYLAATEGGNAPHVLRWRLSLLFLAGRLAELADQPVAAIERFHAASLADWAGFSPILATKAIAAAFHEARLHLARGSRDAAMACFRRGLDTALAAASMPHERLIGDPPLPFYCQEMAEVMDMGGQCANALQYAHLLDRDAGLFWRQIDTRRFGLFAWADGLAREQERLRAA